MSKDKIDIRGEYPHDFNEGIAEELVRVFVDKFKKKNTVMGIVGYDVRVTSKKIFRKVLGVIEEELPKVNLIDLGLCTTPQMQFITNYLGADFGIIVTASHNPSEYNGLKAIWNKDPIRVVSKKKPIDIYAEYIAEVSDIRHPMRVVFDSSNGTTGLVLEKIIPKLSDVGVTLINDTPDGNFPAHGPNPIQPSALLDITDAVKKNNADIGVVYDADGDRAVFVDEKGKMIDVEIIACLLASYLNPNGEKGVMIDSTVGKTFKENVEVKEIITVPVHSDINSLMNAEKIAFGFERSGHFYFPVNLSEVGKKFNFDSGILAAVYVISAISKLMAEEGLESVSEYVRQFSGEHRRVHKDFKVKEVDKVIENIEREYKTGKVSKLDGLTVEYKDWWFNVRSSTTEPVVRLNVEANSEELLKEKFDELMKIILV